MARDLGVEGITAYEANDLKTADEKLERAYSLFAAPTLGLFSARTRVKLGRLIEAAERYRQVTHVLPSDIGGFEAQRAAQAEAAQELAALVPRIPTLTVVLDGAVASGVQVTLDGNPYASELLGMARPTNTGTHRLLATRGSERVEQTVELAEKQNKRVHLEFRTLSNQPLAAADMPQPTAASSSELPAKLAPERAAVSSTASDEPPNLWKPVGITALSLGAVGFITWGVSTIVANAKLDKCPAKDGEHLCPSEDAASAYRTPKTISTVSIWTGAVLTVGGVSALLLGARESRSAQPVSVGFSPTGVAVHGVF